MKRFLLAVLLVNIVLLSNQAQVYNKMVVPDVAGYLTLKGDMHIHTVFSDGSVWPTTRVDEALMEGLDFLAITDHVDGRLQKQKNKGLLNNTTNDSYEIAAHAAKNTDLIVIHGGEISRGMPPGHFNVTFVKDCEPISKLSDAHTNHYKGMEAGLQEAKRQGGFLVWNHPNWSVQAPNEVKWHKEHTKLLNAGLMMGIEVFNQWEGFCKEAFHWAVKNNLTIVSGTDVHIPLFKWMDLHNGELRPVTLVFAKERSLESIHEAMINHRTAVFAEGKVYGTKENILPLNEAILTVKKAEFSENRVKVVLQNNSSIPVVLRKAKGGEEFCYPVYILIQPFAEYSFNLNRIDRSNPLGTEKIDMPFTIENFYVDADVNLQRTITVYKK